jgi:phenylpropionate dioxygenase-like ring-hydroxylating dioxygenase large terminal subunit
MIEASSAAVANIREDLRSIIGVPRERSRAMQAAYYTSPEFLGVERERIFRRQWVCIGHAGEIPHAGDYFTTELIDEPLLAVRDEGGAVHVLSNVCRHRGNIVATGAGNAKGFVCGYHAWSYGLDGRLLAAPLLAARADFDKRACRLPRLATELWQGFIFVNLDGSAAPLKPSLLPIDPYIHNYHPEERHFLFGVEEVWNTNWKCLAENFMEGYHLSPLHAGTLHDITPTALCKKLPDGPAFTGYRARFAPECPERGPYHADLTDEERRSDVFYCIYPSFVVGFCPHFTIYMCLRPLTVDTVGIRWGLTGVTNDREASVTRDYIALCKAFCAEDRDALERLQRGLKSRLYKPGPLAPDDFEGTVWDIAQYMARQLVGDTAGIL